LNLKGFQDAGNAILRLRFNGRAPDALLQIPVFPSKRPDDGRFLPAEI
jgi:hypothetical protein